ncbi:hypothetical protein HYD70_00885 [Mycoplasmopsis bovis]|nr:hypothetical protein [Mycoplasmopsis bovis]QQH49698.1 hypothetical protein HYD70_00885 [Mycoplasmopsis bovis]
MKDELKCFQLTTYPFTGLAFKVITVQYCCFTKSFVWLYAVTFQNVIVMSITPTKGTSKELDGIIIILKLIVKLMKLMQVMKPFAVGLNRSWHNNGDTLINEKALEIVLERMVIPTSSYSNNKYEQAMI